MRASHSPTRRARTDGRKRQSRGSTTSDRIASSRSAPAKHRWGSTEPGSWASRNCSAACSANSRAPKDAAAASASSSVITPARASSSPARRRAVSDATTASSRACLPAWYR